MRFRKVQVRILVGWFVILAAVVSAPASQAAANGAPYRVVGISDGDTLTALSADRERLRCRLYGIDAPEKRQAFGQASKLSLAELSFGRTAQIDIVGRDRYGRALCKIAVAGVDVNKEQIARGMAWMYRRYANERSYSDAEQRAQARRVGIWIEAQPVAPWEFRRKGWRRT
ncbi:MAG: thermonuclease family protein [Telluria sp.]